MKLSIITINYNNRDGLKKTIDSVISQTFTDFEWIVIDGGSTDESKELIEEYSSHMSYWVSEPDKGIYNAMNKGIAHANGEYLQFLNSGDIFHSDDTLKQVSGLLCESDIIYGDICFIRGEESVLRHYPDCIDLSYIFRDSLGHPSSFIKRSCFNDFKYPEDYTIVSDWIGWLLFFIQEKSFKHVDLVICDFATGGISDINSSLLNQERNRALSQYLPKGVAEMYSQKIELETDYFYRKTQSVLHKGKAHRFLLKTSLIILNRLPSFSNCHGKKD